MTTQTLTLTDVAVAFPPRETPLSAYVQPGDGVLDLGANVGEMARDFAQRVGPTGYVLAVEADFRTALACRQMAAEYPQIHVLPVAVAESVGVRTLHLDGQNQRRQSLWRANLTTDTDRTLTVPTLTLDVLAQAVPNLTAIKIDVQGAEGHVLQGGRNTLHRRDLTWYVELWAYGLAHAGTPLPCVAAQFVEHGWHPEGTSWPAVLERAEAKPKGVQNVLLRWRA